MPVYNEEAIIEKTIDDCMTLILSRFVTGEIVVVNDCSTDKTAKVLERLSATNDRLKVISNEKNVGHGSSLVRAVRAARGDHVLCMDSDYQFCPEDFWKLYALFDGTNIVIGQRENRAEGGYRSWMSSAGNAAMRELFSLTVSDINIPFKLFPRSILNKIAKKLPQEALVPSSLLIIAASKMDIPIRQVSVRHFPRNTGQGSLQGWKYFNFGVKAAIEMIRFNGSKS